MPKKAAKGPVYKDIPIKAIERSVDTQSRADMSQDTIDDYAERLRAGEDLGEPIVYFDGQKNWLADGFHRLGAHDIYGSKKVRCEYRLGTKRDAILYACGANAKHGLRRSNKDKHRAVTLILRDEEWRGWSQNAIAKHCGVSADLVARVRVELGLTGRIGQSEVVKGADGREIDTAKIAAANHERAVKRAAEKTSGTLTETSAPPPAAKPRVTRTEAQDEPADDVPSIPVERDEDTDDYGEPFAHADDDTPDLDNEDEETPPSEQDDAVEPPAPGPVDDAGQPIPAHLLPVWRIMSGVAEVKRLIVQARGVYSGLYKEFNAFVKAGSTDAEPLFKGFQINSLMNWFDVSGPNSRRQLEHELDAVVPSIVCKTCDAEGCHECSNRGWLSKSDIRTKRHGDEAVEGLR